LLIIPCSLRKNISGACLYTSNHIVEKVKDSCGDRANVIKIDVDKDRELASQYRIQSIPTIVVFKSGEVVWRASGLQSYDKLMSVLSQMSGND
jgi:thioredoxin 1